MACLSGALVQRLNLWANYDNICLWACLLCVFPDQTEYMPSVQGICHSILTLIMLWAESDYIFHFFFLEIGSDTSYKLSPKNNLHEVSNPIF